MKKINILITSIGGDIGSNIFNILKEQNFFVCNIIGTDIKKYVFCKKYLDKFYKVSKVKSPKYQDEIIHIIKENNIDLVIPSSEYDIVFFKENKIFIKELNVKILVNNDIIIDTFLDKYKTSEALEQMNINIPQTFLFSQYDNQLDFPLIVKANTSRISKKIYLIRKELELEHLQRNLENQDAFIIQNYIGTEEDEYTTTVYRNNQDIKVITFRRTLSGDKTGYAEIIVCEKLELYAKLIAEKYDLKGSINIQSRKYMEDYYIFEINPRISSTVYIRNHFNFSDLLWWIYDQFNINNYEVQTISDNGIGILGFTYEFYDDII